jgi:hypothetical protein
MMTRSRWPTAACRHPASSWSRPSASAPTRRRIAASLPLPSRCCPASKWRLLTGAAWTASSCCWRRSRGTLTRMASQRHCRPHRPRRRHCAPGRARGLHRSRQGKRPEGICRLCAAPPPGRGRDSHVDGNVESQPHRHHVHSAHRICIGCHLLYIPA